MTTENNTAKRSISNKGNRGLKNKQKIMLNRIIIAVIAVVALIVVIFAVRALAGGIGGSAGYKSPEDAIETFVKRVSEEDLEGALATFDSEEQAESLDLEKYIERMSVLVPASMPSSSEYQALNEAVLSGTAATQMIRFVYSMEPNEEVRNAVTQGNVAVSDSLSAKGIVEAISPSNMKGLTVVRCDKADPATQEGDAFQSNMKDVSAIYGCKQVQEYTALLKLDDKYYQGFFTLAEYDKGWKLQSLTATLVGNDAETGIEKNGAAAETTEEEYKQQLSDKE